MARMGIFGYIALACLSAAAGINIFLYPLSFWFRAAFFFIPLALGAYGIAVGSRAFALSAGASLLLVSLRPDVARTYLLIPFAVMFVAYLEATEASVRFEGADAAVSRGYLLRGGAVTAAGALIGLAVYYSSLALKEFLTASAAQAAILDTIYLPLLAGTGLFALLYFAAIAIRG